MVVDPGGETGCGHADGDGRPTSLVEFPGHVGAALAAYSPIGFVALQQGATRLALAGAAVTVALASLPDLDLYGPGVNHRGYTHTVWFAGLVGLACAAAFDLVGPGPFAIPEAGSGTARLAAYGFVVGTVAILSHVAADSLTPMGVAPFAPLYRRRFSLGVTRSADPAANRRLLLLGLGTATLTAALGTAVAPSAG